MMATSRPTICCVLHGLGMGGAEVLAARLARRLGDRFRFLFACLDKVGLLGEQLRDEGFPVHVLGRRPGTDWACIGRLSRLIGRERVDVVHCHQYTPFFYGAMARGPLGRVPILFTEHGRAHPDRPRRKRLLANRLLLRRRDRVVGVGQAVRRALIANEGLPAGRVEVVYNGIDLAAFSRAGADGATVRDELGIGPDGLMILQVARLDPLKDHATAVRTLERVVARRPDARLVLVGAGPLRGQVEGMVREKGLGAYVRALGLRTDVARLAAAADVALLTSVSEGIPLTLIEAMAMGLPVVATDVGGVGEVVENGATGLLAPPGRDDLLAEHILRIADDPGLGRVMRCRGRRRAAGLFSEAVMHDSYATIYREMSHVANR